jgi:hypothetical protein
MKSELYKKMLTPNSDLSGETGKQPMDKTTQDKIKRKLVELAEPMMEIEFTRKKYNELFPEGKIKTPLGVVILGEHQFEKLEENKRQEYLGAMYQVLSDPIVVLSEMRKNEKGEEKAWIYIKSFEGKNDLEIDNVISVVVNIHGQDVSISTGPRQSRQIEKKIKMASILLYLKDRKEGGGPTTSIGKTYTRQNEISTIAQNKSSENKKKI